MSKEFTQIYDFDATTAKQYLAAHVFLSTHHRSKGKVDLGGLQESELLHCYTELR